MPQSNNKQPKFKNQFALRGSIAAVGPSGMIKHKQAVKAAGVINKKYPKRKQ